MAAVQTVPVLGDVEHNLRDHARLAARAAALGACFALFPELSLTGYHRGVTAGDAIAPDDPRLGALQAVADAHALVMLVGAPTPAPGGVRISAFCIAPGRAVTVCSKRFLHPGEEVAFVPGPTGPPLALGTHRVGVAICADIAHPEHARDAAEGGASIYAAGCFITPEGYATDAGLLEGYVRQHRMAGLMANYGGPCGTWRAAGGSAIWSRDGMRLARAADTGEDVIVATLPWPGDGGA